MKALSSLCLVAAAVNLACPGLAPAQNCLTPPAGLVHWWRGEGNGFDSISVQDGMLISGVGFAPGKVGMGFLISGIGDDYIALPENLFPVPASGEGGSPFSFELWFQTTSRGVILGQQDLPPFASTLAGYVPAIYVGTNGLLYLQLFWGAAPQLVSPQPVNDGQFHHVVATYDGAVETLYLDGLAIGSTPLIQEGYAGTYYYQLGTGYTGGWEATTSEWFPFSGIIDEPSLYSRALTATEVGALYTAAAAGKCAPAGAGLVLRHRYSFDGPGSSGLITDSVRRGNGVLVSGSSGFPYTNGVPDGSGLSGNGTLNLQGSSGCVLMPPRLISVLPSFTIEAWVTWNGPSTSSWQRVFDFGTSDRGTNASGLGTNYVIFTTARGGTLLPGFEETTVNPFSTNVDAQALTLNGPGQFPLGQEQYIAITYDPAGGTARLYVNGALSASATGVFNASSRFTDYSNWLGRSQWDRDPYFNGSYNEFRIWEGVLSGQDVASHFSAGPDQKFVTTRPALNIALRGSQLVLSWPGSGTSGFQLQRASGLSAPIWSGVPNAPILTGGHYEVVLPASGAPAFYRLAQ